MLRRADIQTPLHGKDLLPQAGEYTTEVMAGGLAKFLQRYLPQHTPESTLQWLSGNRERREAVARSLPTPLPARPPSMMHRLPGAAVFSALKLAQQDVGDVHISGRYMAAMRWPHSGKWPFSFGIPFWVTA